MLFSIFFAKKAWNIYTSPAVTLHCNKVPMTLYKLLYSYIFILVLHQKYRLCRYHSTEANDTLSGSQYRATSFASLYLQFVPHFWYLHHKLHSELIKKFVEFCELCSRYFYVREDHTEQQLCRYSVPVLTPLTSFCGLYQLVFPIFSAQKSGILGHHLQLQ